MKINTKITIAVVLLLVGVAVGTKATFQVYENIATSQNKLNLKHIKLCSEELMSSIYGDTENGLINSLDICAKNIRTVGYTGDAFVIRKKDAKIVWDASVDCSVGDMSKAYLTKDSVCKLFAEPNTCAIASHKMLTEPPKGTLRWKFDDSEEMVDYMYYDYKLQGDEYIIGMGAQTDEIAEKFRIMFYPVMIIAAMTVIVLLG